jgi:hypothetical protein
MRSEPRVVGGDGASPCSGDMRAWKASRGGTISPRARHFDASDHCPSHLRDLENCGPVDGLSGDDLPLANSALVGCVPRFWLTEATHERIEEPMTICDAEGLRRDYLGLLDDWHLEP